MKKKSLTKYLTLLTTSIFSLTYLFLIPFARIEATRAQDVDIPIPTHAVAGEKRVSKTYIPTGGNSTYLTTSDGEEHLLIQDHITSTRIVESNKGAQQQEYYPYGMTSGEPTTYTDKQFTSHRSLTDTGVYHAGARFYNPQLGIFVSADKVQGPNRYMYAAANPTIYTDPSGKIIPLVIAAIIIGGGAFGAGFGAGYERGSQVAQYGSVQEPAKVVGAGIVGGVAGASVGYLGAVAAPAAIGAMSAGAGATSSVGIIGGAQIGAGACMTNPHCMNAVEAGAQLATGADLPPGYISSPYSDELFYDPRQASNAVKSIAEAAMKPVDVFGTVMVGGKWEVETSYGLRNPAYQDESIARSIVKTVKDHMAYDLARSDYADRLGSLDSLWSGGTGVCRHDASLCTGAAMQIWGGDSAQYFAFNNIPRGLATQGEEAVGTAAHAVTFIDTGFFRGAIDGAAGSVTEAGSPRSFAKGFGQRDGGVGFTFNNHTGSWDPY